MKKITVLFTICCIIFSTEFKSLGNSLENDDWTYGTASFEGSRPSNTKSIGSVVVFYNGNLKNTKSVGGVDFWEGSDEICVIYPKNYNGRELKFISKGGSVQIQYLK
jgi:hypothetical protein